MNNYLNNIENAKAVTAPNNITKDVIWGRFCQAMLELHKFEDREQDRQTVLHLLNNQVDTLTESNSSLCWDLNIARDRITTLEDELREQDPEQQLQEQNDLEFIQLTLDEALATIKRRDQQLFAAHAQRAKVQRKLDALQGKPEKVEFPKGTGRIHQLREMNTRFPGVRLVGQDFVLDGKIIGTLA